MTHRFFPRSMMWAVTCAAAGLLACGDDAIGPRAPDAVAQYWALTLNHHAITLATIAPYDTLTLVATPRTATGAALATTDTVIYTSSDTSVIVTPDGKIRAHTTATLTSNVEIVATMTVGGAQGVTLADTALVNVVAYASPSDVPVVGRFSLQPADSAAMSGVLGDFEATVLDTSTVPQFIRWVQVYYYTPKNNVLTYDRANGGYVLATGIGHAMLYADAVIYGKEFRDSLWLTVGYQTQALIDVGVDSSGPRPVTRGFSSDTVFLGVGGVVMWHNIQAGLPNDSLDVEFTGPAPVEAMTDPISTYVFDPSVNDYRDLTVLPDGGGNIPPFVPLDSGELTDSDGLSVKGRRFTVPGTYTFRSRFVPGTGIIRVVSNADIP